MDEIILTGENGTTRKQTCLNATLSITNPTLPGLGSKPDLHSDKPVTNHSEPLHCLRMQILECSSLFWIYVVSN